MTINITGIQVTDTQVEKLVDYAETIGYRIVNKTTRKVLEELFEGQLKELIGKAERGELCINAD